MAYNKIMYKLTNKSKKRSIRRSKIQCKRYRKRSKKQSKRSRKRSKKSCKRSRKRSEKRSRKRSKKQCKRSRKSKIDGTFGSSGGIQLYTNPTLLPSLPLEFCYKDSRADIVACKYKLTDESNPFIITFPGSEKFYKDLEKHNKDIEFYPEYKNFYSIELEQILKLKNLSLKTFILGLKPAFLTDYTSEEIYYDYDKNDINLIKSIIESGKDVFDMNKDGKLILHESLLKKRYDIVYFLLSNYEQIQANVDDNFIKLLTEPNPEIEMMFQKLNEFLKSRINLLYYTKQLEKFLERHGKLIFTLILYISLFYLLKKIGKDIGNKYLVRSLNINSNYIPKLLIYLGADINESGYDYLGAIKTPLCKAIQMENIEIIKFLIRKGVDINKNAGEDCYDFLIEATLVDNFEIVKLLVDNGKNINAVGIFRETALHRAMSHIYEVNPIRPYRNSYRIAEYLLKNGADENIRNIFNLTARDIIPAIYDRIRRTAKISSEIEKLETITTSFLKRDTTEEIKEITDEIELPEALIKYLKETGVDPGFALYEILKFLIDTK